MPWPAPTIHAVARGLQCGVVRSNTPTTNIGMWVDSTLAIGYRGGQKEFRETLIVAESRPYSIGAADMK